MAYTLPPLRGTNPRTRPAPNPNVAMDSDRGNVRASGVTGSVRTPPVDPRYSMDSDRGEVRRVRRPTRTVQR